MRIVVALGGNALGNTPSEQSELVKNTADSLVDLINEGHELCIVHGNGPQVGMIQGAFDAASRAGDTPIMPLPECGAMSQGYIGFHLQNALINRLKATGTNRSVATIVTQTKVAKDDPAFDAPTKPIGPFYSSEAAIKQQQKHLLLPYVEDSGRGYRFVVASPKPTGFAEEASIKTLVDAGQVIIASGGGGIPVYEDQGMLNGISAVIDKDASSAKMAELIDADLLVILTAVDKVKINFATPEEQSLDAMTSEEAMKHLTAGQFAAGSMKPKVEAALDFLKQKPSSKAIIAALEDAYDAVVNTAGTTITK